MDVSMYGLDRNTQIALNDLWMRLRKLPEGPDQATVNALEEWLRIRGKKSILHPAKDYPVGKFNHLENIRFRWLVPRVFDFVPRKENPFSFTRYNGQTVQPRRLFTDGGSIPRLARWVAQLEHPSPASRGHPVRFEGFVRLYFIGSSWPRTQGSGSSYSRLGLLRS